MQRQENNIYYAGFFVRLGAWLFDTLLVGALIFFIKFPIWIGTISGATGGFSTKVLFQFTVWDIFFYLLVRSYYIVTTYTTGATLGKKIMKLKVISAEGGKVTLWDIIYRETIGKYISNFFFNAGYIIIGMDREKRGFHDMLSDTRVVYDFGASNNIEIKIYGTNVLDKDSTKSDSNTEQTVETKQDVEQHTNQEQKREYYYKKPNNDYQYDAPTYGYDPNKNKVENQSITKSSEEKKTLEESESTIENSVTEDTTITETIGKSAEKDSANTESIMEEFSTEVDNNKEQ